MRCVIITEKSNQYDFVAQFFTPKYGIPEDPLTGSAYTQLVPYRASGKAVKYPEGKINIET
ncbi:MAG: PhzF family phenazine biosynthesis protein [Pseudomonadota bacterium]